MLKKIDELQVKIEEDKTKIKYRIIEYENSGLSGLSGIHVENNKYILNELDRVSCAIELIKAYLNFPIT